MKQIDNRNWLADEEKEYLINLGYEIWEGHGGKCGTFDIIVW